MQFYIAVTDDDWFYNLRSVEPEPAEVNFWTGASANHQPGTPWLFKLHAPNNFVVGGGYFTYYTKMPLAIAWEAFGPLNGVDSLESLDEAIGQYRKKPTSLTTPIGCAVLSQPFFWKRDDWLAMPQDWSPNIVTRKSYDTDDPIGAALWRAVEERAPKAVALLHSVTGGFGKPQIIRPRLNQGAFRLMVTDAYNRRCAVTGEKALPALEAAHILPFADIQTHEVTNGLLLRADIHRLFDLGYVAVAPNYRFLVSKAIHDEFANGHEYYALNERTIALPENPAAHPDKALLERHFASRFRG
jgi:putative restriction endonuclease